MILWHFSNYNVTNHYHVFFKKKPTLSTMWPVSDVSEIFLQSQASMSLSVEGQEPRGLWKSEQNWCLMGKHFMLHALVITFWAKVKGEKHRLGICTGDGTLKMYDQNMSKKKKIQFNIVSLSSHFNDKMIIFFVYSFNRYFWRHGCKTFFTKLRCSTAQIIQV